MNNTELKIDFARPEDIKQLNDLMRESWLATYPNEKYGITEADILPAFEMTPELEQRAKDYFKNNPPAPGYWVVRNGDEVCGYIKVAKQNDGKGRIQGIYIHPKYFGKGVAQMLMDTALDYLKDCYEVYVQCTVYNDRATKFYEKYGFKVDPNIPTPNFKLTTGKELPEQTLIRK